MPSFFYPDLNPESVEIVLSGEEYHHLIHVLRHKSGDIININSGCGWFSTGMVRDIRKNQAVVELKDTRFIERPLFSFAIAFSLLRSQNDEWLVEKATELGVTDLYPLISDYTIRKSSANTHPKFVASTLKAAKQCDNVWLPIVHSVSVLEPVLQDIIGSGYQPVVASETRPELWMDDLDKDLHYCFMVGPEGGFSDKENNLFQSLGIVSISVSTNVLRAETAAITLAAQYNLLRKKV